MEDYKSKWDKTDTKMTLDEVDEFNYTTHWDDNGVKEKNEDIW